MMVRPSTPGSRRSTIIASALPARALSSPSTPVAAQSTSNPRSTSSAMISPAVSGSSSISNTFAMARSEARPKRPAPCAASADGTPRMSASRGPELVISATTIPCSLRIACDAQAKSQGPGPPLNSILGSEFSARADQLGPKDERPAQVHRPFIVRVAWLSEAVRVGRVGTRVHIVAAVLPAGLRTGRGVGHDAE